MICQAIAWQIALRLQYAIRSVWHIAVGLVRFNDRKKYFSGIPISIQYKITIISQKNLKQAESCPTAFRLAESCPTAFRLCGKLSERLSHGGNGIEADRLPFARRSYSETLGVRRSEIGRKAVGVPEIG